MSLKIKIEIPAAHSGGADLIPYFQERLCLLADAMDRDVAGFDERAQIDDVQIKTIDVDGDAISLTYELHFSAYYGCSEIDYAGQHQRILVGYRDGRFWVFPRHQPLPARSTVDEL